LNKSAGGLYAATSLFERLPAHSLHSACPQKSKLILHLAGSRVSTSGYRTFRSCPPCSGACVRVRACGCACIQMH
jgi:hypothetical protein